MVYRLYTRTQSSVVHITKGHENKNELPILVIVEVGLNVKRIAVLYCTYWARVIRCFNFYLALCCVLIDHWVVPDCWTKRTNLRPSALMRNRMRSRGYISYYNGSLQTRTTNGYQMIRAPKRSSREGGREGGLGERDEQFPFSISLSFFPFWKHNRFTAMQLPFLFMEQKSEAMLYRFQFQS